MPAKRANVRRATNRITPEAIEAFRAAQEHQEIYHACIRNEVCRSKDQSRHCAECRAHIEAHQHLTRELDLKPWEVSPLHVSLDDGPIECDGTAWTASIPKARALRAELEAALKQEESANAS